MYKNSLAPSIPTIQFLIA